MSFKISISSIHRSYIPSSLLESPIFVPVNTKGNKQFQAYGFDMKCSKGEVLQYNGERLDVNIDLLLFCLVLSIAQYKNNNQVTIGLKEIYKNIINIQQDPKRILARLKKLSQSQIKIMKDDKVIVESPLIKLSDKPTKNKTYEVEIPKAFIQEDCGLSFELMDIRLLQGIGKRSEAAKAIYLCLQTWTGKKEFERKVDFYINRLASTSQDKRYKVKQCKDALNELQDLHYLGIHDLNHKNDYGENIIRIFRIKEFKDVFNAEAMKNYDERMELREKNKKETKEKHKYNKNLAAGAPRDKKRHKKKFGNSDN